MSRLEGDKEVIMELNPQQQSFLAYYMDPKSDTWGNALQSALKAGYKQEYAESITAKMPDWLAENVGDSKLLLTALKNLNEFLNTTDEKLQVIRWDATKTTLKGLAKNKFSERQEVTGKDGKDLPTPILAIVNKDVPSNNSNTESTELN